MGGSTSPFNTAAWLCWGLLQQEGKVVEESDEEDDSGRYAKKNSNLSGDGMSFINTLGLLVTN